MQPLAQRRRLWMSLPVSSSRLPLPARPPLHTARGAPTVAGEGVTDRTVPSRPVPPSQSPEYCRLQTQRGCGVNAVACQEGKINRQTDQKRTGRYIERKADIDR